MKKSKKIAIILAISATFGGVLSSPPRADVCGGHCYQLTRQI